jgi:hypothetical protein
MSTNLLLYVGSFIILMWGIGHMVPTRSVVASFGALSHDNRLILTMEWVAEGLALSFIGVVVLTITAFGLAQDDTAKLVYRLCAGMLMVMAGWTLATGSRTALLPIKLCPWVKTTCAVLILLGSI